MHCKIGSDEYLFLTNCVNIILEIFDIDKINSRFMIQLSYWFKIHMMIRQSTSSFKIHVMIQCTAYFSIQDSVPLTSWFKIQVMILCTTYFLIQDSCYDTKYNLLPTGWHCAVFFANRKEFVSWKTMKMDKRT